MAHRDAERKRESCLHFSLSENLYMYAPKKKLYKNKTVYFKLIINRDQIC